VRTALSDADLEARRWFKSRMEEAGLRVREDAVANLIERLDPSEDSLSSPCIGAGSHIDILDVKGIAASRFARHFENWKTMMMNPSRVSD
jgi:acetylornithine deacetylase/succinyl-diaminopimelate desuccinylase-like protein